MIIKRTIEIDNFTFGMVYNTITGILKLATRRNPQVQHKIEFLIEGFITDEIPEPIIDRYGRIVKYQIQLPFKSLGDGQTPTYRELIDSIREFGIPLSFELKSLGRMIR